jgi:PAS domain S-box-containing protein
MNTPLVPTEHDYNSESTTNTLNLTTRHQETDEALKTKDLLHSIAQAAKIGMCIINHDYIIEWYNDQYTEWFGPLEKLRGRHCYESFEGRDTLCDDCPSKVVFESAHSGNADSVSKASKVFNHRVISVTAAPVKDAHGQVKQVIMIAHDFTDNHQSDLLLQQARQNFETFFDTIDELLFVLDQEGKIIHANKTVIDRLGYSMEELTGESILIVHPPDRRHEAERILDEMLNGVTEFCPVPLVTKSGVSIPVETRVTQGYWNGKPAIFGVTKDITQLRLSEEKFSKLFYINPSACGVSDLKNSQYIEVNEAFYNLFGFTKEEVIGKTATELGLLTQESVSAILKKTGRGGVVTNVEADLKAKNGEIKHVLLSADNICVQDKFYRFTAVHDITERKLAESEIRLRNELLVLANAEKDKLFSIIAHDLRLPFNAFLGFTQMMAEELDTLTMKEIQKIAVSMRSSAKNLFRLLENLLEWSRMQQGLIPFEPESLQLVSVIEESIESLHEPARTKSINISNLISDDLKVLADNFQLQTIIRNLVSNSIKFTPSGGKITISAKAAAGNGVEMSIKDTGIGISPELIGNIFRLDGHGNRKGTEGEPSTGLGLIICKGYIEKHGGKLWVESEEGKGSTFYFTITSNSMNSEN